jgi:hypothetical protein
VIRPEQSREVERDTEDKADLTDGAMHQCPERVGAERQSEGEAEDRQGRKEQDRRTDTGQFHFRGTQSGVFGSQALLDATDRIRERKAVAFRREPASGQCAKRPPPGTHRMFGEERRQVDVRAWSRNLLREVTQLWSRPDGGDERGTWLEPRLEFRTQRRAQRGDRVPLCIVLGPAAPMHAPNDEGRCARREQEERHRTAQRETAQNADCGSSQDRCSRAWFAQLIDTGDRPQSPRWIMERNGFLHHQ